MLDKLGLNMLGYKKVLYKEKTMSPHERRTSMKVLGIIYIFIGAALLLASLWSENIYWHEGISRSAAAVALLWTSGIICFFQKTQDTR